MPGFGRVRFIDETAPAPKINKKIFKRILKYFVPYWKHLIIAVTAILAVAILGLIPPILIKNIIDQALPHKDLRLLSIYILSSIGVTVLLGFIGVGQTYINTWIAKRIVFDMKNQMYDHLEYMSLKFFSSAKPGEIMTRMTSDIDGVQDIFNTTVVSLLTSIFILITTGIALFAMNWKLAILGLFILPMFVIPTRKVGKRRWKIASESQKKISELNDIIEETFSISGSILMKIFTREKDEYNNFKKTNEEVTKLQIKESLAGRWFIMTISIYATIGPMLIYFYGGYLFIHGELSIGSIIAFVSLLTRMYGPATNLSNVHIDITRSFALFDRIFEYFDKEQEITDKPDAREINIMKGQVQFKNVHFSYNLKESSSESGCDTAGSVPLHETLKDINFTVEPGTMAALVGPSGAGKTTITNLIPRLYDVTGGSVSIDGIDIRDMTIQSLRRQIGIVMQEPYLFNGSIRENLLYGKKDAAEDELITACKAAYIHDFIMSLPDKYDTIVGNRGIKLSGGEKQRVSIARVILKNPSIIILDEATSSLDSVSEEYIQKAMVPLLKGRTSFVIAHRLSTILAADKILVMESGNIVESGKHEELLKKEGLYKDLYDTQFKTQLKHN